MLPRDIFQNHRHIGIDLDETLANTFATWLEFAHSRGSVLSCKTIDDVEDLDLFAYPKYGISLEESAQLWHEFWLSLNNPDTTPLVTHAKEGVGALLQAGKKLSIITARNGNDVARKQLTLDWVGRYFPEIPYDAIYFVNHYSDGRLPKSAVCRELGITLLIDDYIENAEDLTQAGIEMILLEKPWNRKNSFSHPLLYRTSSWQEIIDII